ncbi:MAG: hypothetical protein INR71_04085, partial [Terriglobus roseus]|nr:hypothetical protein [Terriglobus roseus]
LGGYDQLRVKGDNASIAMPTSTEETLLRVSVQSVSMKFNNNSVSSLTANSNGQASTFNAILDFTLPYLYLPNDIVNSLQYSMRLSYNSASDIYLFNNTQSLDITSFTFDLADPSNSNEKTSVTLPFAAFNLSTSWPLGTANYFPIRKAPDNSTFILGRSFFQEAIVVADYERRNFTIGQAAFPSSSNTQIVTIFNTTFDQSTQNSDNNNNSGGGGLSGGAIAGIVIGVVLGLAFLALAFWLWRRRKRQAGKQNSQVHAAAFESAHEEKLGQQANLNRERSDTILSGETAASYELGAMPLAQRPNHNRHVSELSSDSETTMAAKLRPSAIYEMPDTSYLAENERVSNRRSSSPALTSSAPTRETSMRTATTTAPSPIMTAASPAMSSREPLSGVAEVPSPPNSPGPSRQLSVTPSRGVSRFSERSSDMQP